VETDFNPLDRSRRLAVAHFEKQWSGAGRLAGDRMAQEQQPVIVRPPTEEQVRAAFEAYTLAVGKVAHAWNYLQEKLGQLFAVITGADRAIALAVWYSTDNDRAQWRDTPSGNPHHC
jgi:hypothetical protein